MKRVLAVYKTRGETPLGCITKLKKKYPLYKNKKISYAGRLDPMAEGVLLLLIGKENTNRHAYEALEKAYTFTILFGVATDSYDLLGVVTDSYKNRLHHKTLHIKIQKTIQQFLGRQRQVYPPYSAKHIQGKPLYHWARSNMLQEITLPDHDITIHSLSILASSHITVHTLVRQIEKEIQNIKGDFRQKQCIASWKSFEQSVQHTTLPTIQFHITCTSGTYIRQLTHDIGKTIHIPSTTYSIVRTQVGSFTTEDTVSL